MTDWSVTQITALAAGGAVLMGAFFAGIVSVITAWRTIAGKVSAIEAHVNSEATAANGRENTLKRENELLREMLTDHKIQSSLVAQSVATTAAVAPIAATVELTTPKGSS